ncbi:zinc finger MYM-type protein 1-like [Hordeum vulgare subsp. vulgare]|uniref:zinc finger MYM-type protein 1-like n=1 Tax=Hordeum vulgare subsp. vulgare TaxID=112509 RepID=UPI001D1A4738|nr:zinc finger MYM-type protein 1-like [Hordeum vulgare subsp. vulgare]
MDRKRKRASKTNGRGLARYFEVVGSGSSSNPNPSTHESRNATTSLEATAHSVHQNQAHVERVTDPVEGDNANFTVEENVDSGLEVAAFRKHVGGPSSIHNISRTTCDDFKTQKASLKSKVTTYTKGSLEKYETRVDTSLGIVSYLALQGEPFRGHDESTTSLNKGNFLELLDWVKERNPEVKVAFDELCPKNAKMTSGIIQKALAKHCAMAITKAIKEEMDGCLFSVLIDECRDISVKEQMAVVVRFLSKKGETMERFLGIKHVPDTTSASLKKALLEVFAKHGLLVARLRGQGYDGASNMRGEFNGLQKLIRDENPHAFYIHCFAHQLQLIVVAVSRCCKGVEDFFDYVTMIVNLSSSSCRRKDMLLDKQKEVLLAKIEGGEVPTGRGKNQETSLVRPGDTRWGSHYRTLSRIESMWDAVIEVLGIVEDDVRVPCRAGGLVHQMETFSFVFILKMMLKLLRMTNDLSLLLQKKDQNVVQVCDGYVVSMIYVVRVN